jgi:hypothetical protein
MNVSEASFLLFVVLGIILSAPIQKGIVNVISIQKEEIEYTYEVANAKNDIILRFFGGINQNDDRFNIIIKNQTTTLKTLDHLDPTNPVYIKVGDPTFIANGTYTFTFKLTKDISPSKIAKFIFLLQETGSPINLELNSAFPIYYEALQTSAQTYQLTNDNSMLYILGIKSITADTKGSTIQIVDETGKAIVNTTQFDVKLFFYFLGLKRNFIFFIIISHIYYKFINAFIRGYNASPRF